jgi:molybdopterin-biosynthesis enzyme MoeA-like protein
MKFGLLVIGDEILRRKRKDRHFDFFSQLLPQHGHELASCCILPDAPDILTDHLARSMATGTPCFVCGGIGATPDDFTRQCAATAAGVGMIRHEGARALIEERFGDDAYPNRIRMADLPAGSELIPNPHNRVPGFSLRNHYFLPGFPQMAHPMAEWVLDTCYKDDNTPEQERAVRVFGLPETELMPLMEELVSAYPDLKLFSLPRMGEDPFVELGLRGRSGIDEAFARLRQGLDLLDCRYA